MAVTAHQQDEHTWSAAEEGAGGNLRAAETESETYLQTAGRSVGRTLGDQFNNSSDFLSHKEYLKIMRKISNYARALQTIYKSLMHFIYISRLYMREFPKNIKNFFAWLCLVLA